MSDTDGDGLSDGAELRTHMTGLTVADTDGDGLSDLEEVEGYTLTIGGVNVVVQTDPNDTDTDDDTLTDSREREGIKLEVGGREQVAQSDPTRADTDGDGLRDDLEFSHECNPQLADTDGMGWPTRSSTRTSPTAHRPTLTTTASATWWRSTCAPAPPKRTRTTMACWMGRNISGAWTLETWAWSAPTPACRTPTATR